MGALRVHGTSNVRDTSGKTAVMDGTPVGKQRFLRGRQKSVKCLLCAPDLSTRSVATNRSPLRG